MAEMTEEWLAAYQAGVFTEFMEQRGPGHTVLDDKIYHKGCAISSTTSTSACTCWTTWPTPGLPQAGAVAGDAHRRGRWSGLPSATPSWPAAGSRGAGGWHVRRAEELLRIADVCRHVPPTHRATCTRPYSPTGSFTLALRRS